MVQIGYKIEGVEEVRRSLRRFARFGNNKRVQAVLRRGLRELTKPLVAEIKANTSVDTGALRDSATASIRIPTANEKRRGAIIKGQVGYINRKRVKGLWARAMAEEYGIRSRGIPAKATLRTAIANFQGTIARDFSKVILKELEKERKRVGFR